MNNKIVSSRSLSTLDKLDVLRFISANLVILCHLIDQFIVGKFGYEDPLGIGHLNCWLGIMAVFCFFVLSGYVITFSVMNKYRKTGRFDLKAYISRRFFRIYPTALCSLVYMLCIVLIMKVLGLNGLDSSGFKLDGYVSGVPNYLSGLSFLYSMFLPPSGYFGGFFNVAMWTLSYEFGFYVCFGVIFYLKTNYGAMKSAMLVGFTSCSLFVWHTTNFNIGNVEKESMSGLILNFLKVFPSWNFLLFFMVWSLGVFLYYLMVKNSFSMQALISLSCLASVLMLIANKYFDVPFNYNVYSGMSALSDPEWSPIMTFSYGIWMMLFVYLIVNIEFKAGLLHLTSAFGRRYSFTLYVTHYGMINLAFGLLWNLLDKFTLTEHVLLFLSLMILTNIIAYYLSTLFEHRDMWKNVFNKPTTRAEGSP